MILSPVWSLDYEREMGIRRSLYKFVLLEYI